MCIRRGFLSKDPSKLFWACQVLTYVEMVFFSETRHVNVPALLCLVLLILAILNFVLADYRNHAEELEAFLQNHILTEEDIDDFALKAQEQLAKLAKKPIEKTQELPSSPKRLETSDCRSETSESQPWTSSYSAITEARLRNSPTSERQDSLQMTDVPRTSTDSTRAKSKDVSLMFR